MTLPQPPTSSDALTDFPSLLWGAHRPLFRIHRQEYSSLFFASHSDGRWNPTQPGVDWGTCYTSTSPIGAAVEVFGRFRALPQLEIDQRVLATLYLPSDVRLADVTHPSVLGRYGLTAAASTGEAATYSRTQQWAMGLREAGFAGIHYAASHDPTLGSRSVALFGKVEVQQGEGAAGLQSEWDEESTVTVEPIPLAVIVELRDTFDFQVLGGGRTL